MISEDPGRCVSRGHSQIGKFQSSVNQPNNIQKLALSMKLYNPKVIEDLEHSLNYFSEFIRHHLKESCKPNSFNCPQSIDSNLSWRKFLFNSLNYLINNNLNNIEVNWPTWTKNAKKLIRDLPKQEFCSEVITKTLVPLLEVNLTSPSGSAKLEVASSLGSTTRSLIPYRKSTIHGAKGESHDVAIFISSARSGNESHWKSWIKSHDSEAARFAYVASSRPKEFLIWAVKTLKETEKKQLEALGFTII